MGVLVPTTAGGYLESGNPYSPRLPKAPGMTHIAKEPVLYFHSRDKKPFSLRVIFPNGQPTFTFPHAVTLEKGLEWKDVQFTENPTDGSTALPTTDDVDREEMNEGFYYSSILNDVDADEMKVDGKISRFLFYEGQVDYQEKVVLRLKADHKTAVVQNLGSTPVADLFISVGTHRRKRFQYLPDGVMWGALDRLAPGQTALVRLWAVDGRATPAFPDLRKNGFTAKEAGAFEKLWAHEVKFRTATETGSACSTAWTPRIATACPNSISPPPPRRSSGPCSC